MIRTQGNFRNMLSELKRDNKKKNKRWETEATDHDRRRRWATGRTFQLIDKSPKDN